MITIWFQYWSVSNEKWELGRKEFTDVEKARRFIIKCKKDVNLAFVRYACDDPEDNEYLWSRT